MQRADRATIEAGTPGHVLMERAGRAAARAALRVAGGRYGRRAAVVCGPGNNGGDGFVAARALRRAGMAVTCLLVGNEESIRGDALLHLGRMKREGIELDSFDGRGLLGAGVIVDALFGTGFRGSAEGDTAAAIDAMNSCRAPVVAIDIPSGVAGATGRVDGPAVNAAVTVAMGAEKIGTALPPGSLHAGTVDVVDIGIALDFERDVDLRIAELVDVRAVMRARPPDAHKRSAGSVVLIAGSDATRGAPILAARGAIRAGAGYVTLVTTPAVKAALATSVPEALCEATNATTLGPEALDDFGAAIGRADAVALGPGLGIGDAQRDLVRRAVTEIDKPLVLDADALNVLAGAGGASLDRTLPFILTPHPAELARLLGRTTEEVVGDRLDAARSAARLFPHTVVLAKGHRSIVVWNGGSDAVVVPVGGPELATAGTGDVLTGALAATLAAGTPASDAAWAGAWLHASAGAEAAALRGAEGVAAGDVADCLGPARAELSSALRA